MQSLSQIKSLLDSRGLAPKRSLGQNFLVDHNLLRKLIDAAGVQPADLILEVGPGTGVLTEELLARVGDAGRVIACELDDSLAAMLRERAAAREFSHADRLTVIHADCLESKGQLSVPLRTALTAFRPNAECLTPNAKPLIPTPLAPRTASNSPPHFRLVANLPYGCATPLIITLLLQYPACSTLAVTIQNEVADRLLAPPRTPDRGMLSVIAQAFAHVERVATLPRECFWPRPDVTSAMVLLRRHPTPPVTDPLAFAEFCKRLFAQRRKQLGGVLGRHTQWPGGTSAQSRAEELSLPQILELFHNHSAVAPVDPPQTHSDRTPIAE